MAAPLMGPHYPNAIVRTATKNTFVASRNGRRRCDDAQRARIGRRLGSRLHPHALFLTIT